MSNCVNVAGASCSYVNITSDNETYPVFTWWMTLGRDHNNSPMVTSEFVTLLLITLIAIPANIFVFIVIVRDRKLRSIPTHQYTAAHCIDFLAFISISPMLLLARKAFTWTNSVSMCKSILYIFSVAGFNAIWLFALISMDRFMKVVHAVEPSVLAKVYPSNPYIAISLMVTFSVTYYIPLAIFADIRNVVDDDCTNATKCFMGEDSVEQIQICANLWQDPIAAAIWWVFMTTFCYLMPLLLICFNYIRIYLSVRKVGKRIRRKTVTLSNADRKKEMEIRVSRICALLVFIFILLWSPIFVILYLVQFSRVYKNVGILSSDAFYWIFILTLANSMINPLAYAFMNKKFVKTLEENGLPILDYLKCISRFKKRSTSSKVEPESSEVNVKEKEWGAHVTPTTSQPTSTMKNSNERTSNTQNVVAVMTPCPSGVTV